MSRRLSRISLVLLILLSSEVWALGLGDIRLESALNEPLRARIELLSASSEELNNLKIGLASAQTFERYGLDRPYYLQNLQFQIVHSGKAEGNVVLVTSTTPMSEPFLTFLVEATWSRGRLLREYTVLLDPPTYAPPAEAAQPPVQAPARTAPADSGRIERPAPVAAQPQPRETPAPVRQPAATPAPAPPEQAQAPFETNAGGEVLVQRHDTLWSIAQRVRPDSRLTMNQTMMAIFQANPEAFGGNINILRAGSRLRIPSADDIFRIDRGDALAEARRQNDAWRGGAAAPAATETETRPSLTLVPPDQGYEAETAGAAPAGQAQPEPEAGEQAETPAQPMSREDEIEKRIAEIEAEEPPQQQSLLQIRNNELAALRAELARIRGEISEQPEQPAAGEAEQAPEPGEIKAEQGEETPAAEGEETAGEAAEQPAEKPAEQAPPSQIIHTEQAKPGFVDQAMDLLKSYWMIIIIALAIVAALLFWMMRRGGGDDDDVDSWQPLDADEMGDDLSATGGMRALDADDESIVVVEQDSKSRRADVEKTVVTPPPSFEEEAGAKDETGTFGSLEDTFSSETAINLDQSDPIAEADFHMAYGLYDQAADLVNGALEVEPKRPDLLTKLCEIYFVWGNRDAFIDAARRLKSAVGEGDSDDWDKIVIMGQQIAGDDKLFAGAVGKGATKAVDLAFDEGDLRDTGKLDMELVADSDAGEFVDFGSDDTAGGGDDEIDFFVDSGDETVESADTEVTREMSADTDATREMQTDDRTSEMPTIESALESPTIEEQFDAMSGTAELPSLDESTLGEAIEDSGHGGDHTAEINLDDLGLDIDGLADTEFASLDDLDATSETEALSDTGINAELADSAAETGRNLEIDEDATGLQEALGSDDTGINESLDDTGINRQADDNLLDATGMTQVLSSDLAVDTTTDAGAELSDEDATLLASDYGDEDSDDVLGDDQETMLASLDDDDSEDFDFAKTEALPKDTFTGSMELDETGEMPAIASTDVDLDLDDLTAALKVSEAAGDTVEQVRDDATVEQPRPGRAADDEEDAATMSLGPEDLDDDLHDARTMTEVGTKLDLARAYVDMGDPSGARSILEEVLDEGDEAQRQQAQQLLDSLPG